MLTLPLARFDRFYAAHLEKTVQIPALTKAWIKVRMALEAIPTAHAARGTVMSLDGAIQ